MARNMTQDKPLLDVGETAARLHLSRRAVRNLIARGELRAVNAGGELRQRLRIPSRAVDELVSGGDKPPNLPERPPGAPPRPPGFPGN